MSLFYLRCTRLCASCQKRKLIELCWNHQSEEENVLLLQNYNTQIPALLCRRYFTFPPLQLNKGLVSSSYFPFHKIIGDLLWPMPF